MVTSILEDDDDRKDLADAVRALANAVIVAAKINANAIATAHGNSRPFADPENPDPGPRRRPRGRA